MPTAIFDAGEDQDTDRFIEISLRDLVWFKEDLFQNFGRVAQAIVDLVLSNGGEGHRDAHES